MIIDSKVKIIDCPGVVFDADNKESVLLRNIVKVLIISNSRSNKSKILEDQLPRS